MCCARSRYTVQAIGYAEIGLIADDLAAPHRAGSALSSTASQPSKLIRDAFSLVSSTYSVPSVVADVHRTLQPRFDRS